MALMRGRGIRQGPSASSSSSSSVEAAAAAAVASCDVDASVLIDRSTGNSKARWGAEGGTLDRKQKSRRGLTLSRTDGRTDGRGEERGINLFFRGNDLAERIVPLRRLRVSGYLACFCRHVEFEFAAPALPERIPRGRVFSSVFSSIGLIYFERR